MSHANNVITTAHRAMIVDIVPSVYIMYTIADIQPVNKRHNRYSVIKFENLPFIGYVS